MNSIYKKTPDGIVEDYLKALIASLQRSGHTEFWPFGPGQVDSYFEDILSVTLFEKFKEDPEKFKEALNLLPANYLRWYFLPFVILGLKLARNYDNFQITNQEMVNLVATVWEVLKGQVSSDPFCLDGKSLVLTADEVKSKLAEKSWLDNSFKKQINILSVDLEAYIWSIDFDIFAYGVFWHGPYFSEGKTLVIKQFSDLDSSVWDINEKYTNIEILFVFNKEIDITIDFMGHALFSSEIWEYFEKAQVLVDGKPLESISQVAEISEYFASKSSQQVDKIKKMTPEELIIKGGEVYYYMLRKFFEFYKEDWRPPETFYFRVKKWGLQYWDQFKQDVSVVKKPENAFFSRLYDPRNSFTD